MKKYKDSIGLTIEKVEAMSSEERATYGIGEMADWDDEDESRWIKNKPRHLEQTIKEGHFKDYSLEKLTKMHGLTIETYNYFLENRALFVKQAVRGIFTHDDSLCFYGCTQGEYDSYFGMKGKEEVNGK